MSLTAAQKQAVARRGNVLVVAGAGTGKTSTLVERCLACLLEEKPPASLEEILMVTFTDAAAAEMRRRIRARLEEQPAGRTDVARRSEQLALFDTAHIGTLHSFCLQLLKQHFYELKLDPQLTVMPEEEARLLAEETLDEILRRHYAADTEFAAAVQQLIQSRGRGWDQPVRALVLRLHHYTQTLRDPEGWFDTQLAMFQSPEPAQWRAWLISGVLAWRNHWQGTLEAASAGSTKAAACAELLRNLPKTPSREDCAVTLEQVRLADQDWPPRKKISWRKPLEDYFDEAGYLLSLAKTDATSDPLAEDWQWTRGQMAALLNLAREFSLSFGESKRELGMVDFHDLEQHALRLLWDRATGRPTEIALQWREKLRFVFVDEYQDINDAQDAILKALSREGPVANRFLVGDVKQSIYRFRLADPRIFQHYAENWRGAEGSTIPLQDNFRSRESILQFVNSLFGALMRPEIGGVAYDGEARLRFGDPENRAPLSLAHDPAPRVELLLRLKSAEPANPEDSGEDVGAAKDIANLEESGKEARLVALRLRELKTGGHLIWDEQLRVMRPVDWGDMAVLLRSPSGKAESFAREFSRFGVPLVVARSGFYESAEVADLLSLLNLFNNPLQDLPALAVLRSPLVGLSLDELAAVRLALPQGHFWTALHRYHDQNAGHSGWNKADRFLKNFSAWRRLARQVSLSRCLQSVLDGTHYADWLLTQARGEQRRANVQRLLTLAQQFDRFQRQGLFRFLRFVEAQQAAEIGPDAAAVAVENSVSLMSIHQSKGLEFPVVAVADLGKPFNLSDLRAEIILDTQYGLCPLIKPPHSGRRYPSLPFWLAREHQRQDSLGEELRLLYVATTRARDTLILSGSASAKKFAHLENDPAGLTTASLLAARNYLDWLAAWAASAGAFPSPPSGENQWWRWAIYEDADSRLNPQKAKEDTYSQPTNSMTLDDASFGKLRERLAWQYPHFAATREPAKTSVTAVRRRLADENDDEAEPMFWSEVHSSKSKAGGPPDSRRKTRSRKPGRLSAAEIGLAHHTFLQWVSLEKTDSVELLREEAKRLQNEQMLSAGETATLDLPALAAFWQSEMGNQIRAHAPQVRRELPFTARFASDELMFRHSHNGGDTASQSTLDGEFVVVQGVADLAVLLPNEIWLVDFKTDQITAAELQKRVKIYEPQLRLYALALSRVYRRPVARAALHFLALRQSVVVSVDGLPAD